MEKMTDAERLVLIGQLEMELRDITAGAEPHLFDPPKPKKEKNVE